jgi:hypothetical protein
MNVFDFENVILNLDNYKHEVPKNEVYEYYFMHHIHKVDSLLFENYDLNLQDSCGYKNSTTISVYRYFTSSSNKLKPQEIIGAFVNFISSGDERLQLAHFVEKKDFSR